jgi:hypothetical protein
MTPSAPLISELTADWLAPYTGQTFVFEGPGGEASMELVDVTRLKKHAGASRDPFSLLFAMRGQKPLDGGILRLIHRDFEPLDVFLQRVTVPDRERADPAAMFYEAVFN